MRDLAKPILAAAGGLAAHMITLLALLLLIAAPALAQTTLTTPRFYGVPWVGVTSGSISSMTMTNIPGAETNCYAWYPGESYGGVWTNWSETANLNLQNEGDAATVPTAATTPNSKPSVFFNGGAWLTNAAFTLAQPSEYWMVMSASNNPSATYQLFFDGRGSSSRNVFYRYLSSDTFGINATTDAILSQAVTNKWIVVRLIFNGASSTIYTNGVQGATGNPGSYSMAGLTVGTRFTLLGTYASKMNLAEFVAFKGNLNSTSASNVNYILTNKYSIAQP